MRGILRKLRGALGTAVTWALGWGLGAFALVSVGFLLFGKGVFFWDTVRPITILAGLSGFIGGTVFSTALATIHARRRISELSPLRMALWGAGAGLLVPLGVLGVSLVAGVPLHADVVAGMVVGIGGLGAATAAGTVKLAQASDRALDGPDRNARLLSGE